MNTSRHPRDQHPSTYTIARRTFDPKQKDDPRVYVVTVERQGDYTRYTITLNGKTIRRQISAPSQSDCEQGESDVRRKTHVAGFSP